MPKPNILFRIDFAQHCSVGTGKIRLLESIGDSALGSQMQRKDYKSGEVGAVRTGAEYY